MNNILAAKVLMRHLPEIKDGAYKTATEIAIGSLFGDAINDWQNFYFEDLTLQEYLELSNEDYYYWVLGGEKVAETKR